MLFVYGSLRRGGQHHGALGGARLLGTGRTAPGWRLLDCGAWPGMVPGGAGAVTGELYAVDAGTLAGLDALEDAPRTFSRRRVALEGPVAEAEAYVLVAVERAVGEVVGGDWVAYASLA